jgi:hypothetical protein
MEYAKIAQRIEESIVCMEEEKIVSREKEKAEKTYQDLMSIPKIMSVKIIDQYVHIYTKNIFVQNEKDHSIWHDIGTFHIVVGVYGTKYNTSSTVRIFNTKHQIHAFQELMQAPHVFDDGHLCHGNITGAMVDAYGRRDIYQMALIIIMFLESANLDDVAGGYLNRWPAVTEDVAKNYEVVDEFAKIFEKKSETEERFDAQLDIPIHV